MTDAERRFVIDLMIWSFSRLNSFSGCKFEWLLKYIEEPGENIDSCYGQGGNLSHKLLEKYAKGELGLFELAPEFEKRFPEEVIEYFPIMNGKNLRDDYYEKCLDYFCNFAGIPNNYEILGVEKEVEFEIEGYPFVGFIDLLLRDKKTEEIIILDHKSSSLKFKKNGDLTKGSLPKFEEFKKQLYLYSIPIINEYGPVSWLEWNLFKDQKKITIPWKLKEFTEAKKWAVDTIHKIENETEWEPNPQYMYCRYLCSKRLNCPYKYQKEEQ